MYNVDLMKNVFFMHVCKYFVDRKMIEYTKLGSDSK